MALSITINNLDQATDSFYVRGSLSASGSYTSGGDTLDFSGKGDLPVSTPPRDVFIHGTSGFVYEFVRGTSLANNKMILRGQQPTSATSGVIALSEMASGAYPSGVTGDTITFLAIFDKLL